jgi:hypothetical protein
MPTGTSDDQSPTSSDPALDRTHRADRWEEGADQRERLADERDAASDERDWLADERDR